MKVKKEEKQMKINILNKGDKVLNVTENFIAVERKNGEVDIVPLAKDENGSGLMQKTSQQ